MTCESECTQESIRVGGQHKMFDETGIEEQVVAVRDGVYYFWCRVGFADPPSSVPIEDEAPCMRVQCVEKLQAADALHKCPLGARPLLTHRLSGQREGFGLETHATHIEVVSPPKTVAPSRGRSSTGSTV